MLLEIFLTYRLKFPQVLIFRTHIIVRHMFNSYGAPKGPFLILRILYMVTCYYKASLHIAQYNVLTRILSRLNVVYDPLTLKLIKLYHNTKLKNLTLKRKKIVDLRLIAARFNHIGFCSNEIP